MRDFVLILKVLLKDRNSSGVNSKGKKKLSKKLSMLLPMSPLVIMISVMMVFLGMGIADKYSLSVVVNMLLSATQVLVLFISLASVITTLYSSADTPFLSTLPIRSSSVFFAKFSLVYLNALELCAMFLVPLLLSLSIAYAAVGNVMFYGFYPLILLIVLVAPILPLFIVTLFSMPAVWLGSFFKGRSVLKSVLTIIFYVVIMCAYMVLIFYMNTEGFGQNGIVEINGQNLGAFAVIANVMYPNKVLIEMCLGIEAGKNFGIFVALTLGMLAIILLLSMVFYKRISEKHVEKHSEETQKNVSYKQQNIVFALIKRDFTAILRNPSMALSSFANMIIAPLFILMMYFIMFSKADSAPEEEQMSAFMSEMMAIGFVLLYSIIFLCSTNMLASMAYTREGKSFYVTKALPIGARQSITAKIALAVAVPMIVLIPILLLAIFLFKIGILSVLMCAVTVVLMVIGMSCINIYSDMKKGSIHWDTSKDMQQITQKSTMLSTLIGVFIGAAFFTIGIIMSAFGGALSEVIIKVIYWAIVVLLSAVVCTVGICLIRSNGDALFAKIGENKVTIKKRASFSFGTNNNDGFLK